ncbi:unnamed protein product [Microthlaspi erraticum]|uniref:FBD domain-containing protein n=1 Tax=Microthlaspi erraticum TaxID=1685480 RepID=A0A6D2LC74_9BRAS|nr:unnamed protein product [Microthlaspi erraticum]
MDRISGLCDELLVKILLLLPTKVAVSTSVLSKRWERLWMWMPKLDYDDQSYSEPECKNLRCFLVRSLPLHIAPVIESLRLKLSNSHFTPEVIELLVSVAVSRYVRELDISYSHHPKVSNMLPSNLFTCKSLVILKLDDEILLDVPRVACLPSLKTLQLQRVTYSSEESLQRLLSSCPVLEELLVELNDDDDYMVKFTIIVPSLQSLSLYIPYLYVIYGYVIKTPSLKYFKLKDHNSKSHYCLVENMPNLIEAYVDVEFPDIKSLVGSIKSAKRLEICSEAMYDEGIVFRQLEHLKVCRCKECASSLLVRLLKDSPKLRELDHYEMIDHYYNGTIFWNQPSTVPECMLSSLRVFNWSAYTGVPEEKDLAIYILKNANRLETMTISFDECDIPEAEMIKELELPSRASKTCQLIFD